MGSSMVSYRPVGKQFRITCQSAREEEKMEDVSTHESLMTNFVNTLINTKKSHWSINCNNLTTHFHSNCALWTIKGLAYVVLFWKYLAKCAAQLAKCARVWPIARAIYQTLHNWSNAARLTNWSNALRDCPNAQIGQMRLTILLAHMNKTATSFFLLISMIVIVCDLPLTCLLL